MNWTHTHTCRKDCIGDMPCAVMIADGGLESPNLPDGIHHPFIHDASAFSLHGQLESWRCFPSSLCGFGRVPSWHQLTSRTWGWCGWAVKQDSYGPNMGHQATLVWRWRERERERTHTIGQVLSLTCDKPPPILPLMVKPSQCGNTVYIPSPSMPQY